MPKRLPYTDQIRKGTQHTFYHGPIRDHALRGKVYRSATARSEVSCAVFCLQEDACKSFNYREDAEVCELNSAVYARDKSDLQPSNGWMYFDEEYHGGMYRLGQHSSLKLPAVQYTKVLSRLWGLLGGSSTTSNVSTSKLYLSSRRDSGNTTFM